jgi:hypothetical protein
MRLGISFKSESKKTLMPLKAAHQSANCDGPGGPLMSSRLAINVATYSPEEVLASAATERNIFRFSRCCVPRRSTPKDKGELLLLEGMCMIDDQQLARLRAHRNNILRYRNLLQTSLTELEREFVEKRLGEEQSALENLATILPNGAMNF